MRFLRADIRLAIRTLRRRPAFTLLAVLTLTIGVGANTAVFGLINGVFLKPVPLVQEPNSLVEIGRRSGGEVIDLSYPVFRAIREERGLLRDAAAYTPLPVSITAGDDAAPVVRMVLNTTGNYFDVLGVQPAAGRFFAPDESFYPAVVPAIVISDRLWRDRFSRRPDVVGRTLRVNGVPLTIIGVTPSAFRGHAPGIEVDAYVPVGVRVPGLQTPATLDDPRSGSLQIIARVQPNVTRPVVTEALGNTATRYLASVAPPGRARERHPVRVDAFSPVPAVIRDGVAAFLAVLLAISGLLLAMTCVNVAGMILSRATERQTEIAVRFALGASRRRIIAQLLTESTLLFVIAGIAGALLAAWATPLLMAFQPPLPPGFSIDLDLRADWRVLGYASLVATACGILFSIVPTLRATRTDLAPMIREQNAGTGRARTRLRGVLVGMQMAGTVVLLIVAVLFSRALGSLDALDPGWNPDGVYVTSLDLELNGTREETGLVLFDEMTRRVSAVPGVRAAGIASKLPFSGQSSLGPVAVEGSTEPPSVTPAYFNRVSTGYFQAMGIRLLRGRDVAPSDDASSTNVAVINEAMANRLWPGQDPVGRRFQTGLAPNLVTFEVVGVAANAKVKRLNEETPNAYYVPYRQRYNTAMHLLVRLDDGVPTTTLATVRDVIRQLAPSLPAEPLRPLRAALDVYFLPQRIAAWVGGVLGMIGMLIAAVGAYGVAAIAVAQRRRELGIRMALGARPADVARLLVRQVVRAPAIGAAIGLVLAIAVTQPLRAFLGVVSPVDPASFAASALALAGVIAFATWAPARRAARLDPVEVLRRD
ncbi:MAG: permease [Geminicoccaceae bacterium]|jgi:predicted permease|nr:permease [Geminicoccaceae bacterium]